MKYIIELDDNQLLEYDKDTDTYFRTLYKAKGFNTLVFDKNGLDKLTLLDKELEEAYQKGFEAGQHEATTQEYQQGLEDMHKAIQKISNMSAEEKEAVFDGQTLYYAINEYTTNGIMEKLAAYEEQQKADEIKVSDVITDGKCNYLVIDITDKSYIALQGTDFEPVYIGKDYIKSYHNLHDSKDMTKVAEEINRAVKGEQRDCHTCKHQVASSIECVDCRGFGKWEPKGGDA